MFKRIECKITGRVQGVLYRDFVQKKARILGITGVVRNLSDGSVEVVAEGNKENIGKFLSFLEKGPVLAKVVNVETRSGEATGLFDSFEIAA